MRKIRLKSPLNARLAEQFQRELNDSQRAAVTAPDGYNLILAGPGSGKTRVITYRVAYLIASGVPPESIMLVTFTRRAAREMVRRMESLIGQQAGRVWAGTFHHIGNRLLRRAAGLLGLSTQFHHPRQRGPARPDPPGHGRRRALRHGQAGPQAGRGAPPDQLQRQRQPSPRRRSSPSATPSWSSGSRRSRRPPRPTPSASSRPTRMDYDDLLLQWGRLIREFPDERAAQARMFRHILIDEMQDTNAVQVEVVEAIAAAGPGNLSAVGDDAQSIYRFRGADYDNILKFPERHPGARIFQLEVNYRSTPQIVAFTRASIAHNTSGFPKDLVSARPDGCLPLARPHRGCLPGGRLHLPADPRSPRKGPGARARWPCSIATITTASCCKVSSWHAASPTRSAAACGFSSRPTSRTCSPTCGSCSTRATKPRGGGCSCSCRASVRPRPRRFSSTFPGAASRSSRSKQPRRWRSCRPRARASSRDSSTISSSFARPTRRRNPAAAVGAILKGGYPATVKLLYERPDNRIADIEQFALLAAKYDSLERLIADLLLAGDVYGMDSADSDEPGEVLVLSTVHQAKGLEWSHVFIPRVVEESFPHRRALDEPGGEDEERRIFYVAITRAMNELTLTYPLTMARGGRGPTVFTMPSRFLTEIDDSLVERAEIEIGRSILMIHGRASRPVARRGRERKSWFAE